MHGFLTPLRNLFTFSLVVSKEGYGKVDTEKRMVVASLLLVEGERLDVAFTGAKEGLEVRLSRFLGWMFRR